MTNLLDETIKVLEEHNKTLDDVEWIGTTEIEISVNEFIKEANREYDDGYGDAEVNLDLVVVGKDFWLERNEYDGSEWWDFKMMPKRPMPKKLYIFYEPIK